MSEAVKKTFTREQVAKNNGKNSTRTWIIIDEMIYDVTDYLEEVKLDLYLRKY